MANWKDDTYLLTRDYIASGRLNLQHHLWQKTYSWYTHPSIILGDFDTRIADVGTGTGLWLMEVAHFVPKSMKLFGIDIDLSQCPPQEWLPSNVTLYKWDAYSEVPEELLESFDVVVMRDMTLAVRNGDPSLLLKNVLKLLKPGGHLQWGEWDARDTRIEKIDPNSSILGMEKAWAGFLAFRGLHAHPKWPGTLDAYFREAGMTNVKIDARYGPKSHIQYETDNYLMMFDEALSRLRGKASNKRLDDAVEDIERAAREVRAGNGWIMKRVLVAGQKPKPKPKTEAEASAS